jgi:hypothetical protein
LLTFNVKFPTRLSIGISFSKNILELAILFAKILFLFISYLISSVNILWNVSQLIYLIINYSSGISEFFATSIADMNMFFSPLLIFKLRTDNDLDKFTKETDGGKYRISDLASCLTGSCGNLFGLIEISILRRLGRRLRLIIIWARAFFAYIGLILSKISL